MAKLGCNKTYRKRKHLGKRRLYEDIFTQRHTGDKLHYDKNGKKTPF